VLAKDLSAILGADHVLTSQEDLACFSQMSGTGTAHIVPGLAHALATPERRH
jgi:hypothetical protein